MTTEDDFHRLLDADPADHQTRLIFADWLQDRGDPRAEPYRVLGLLRRVPKYAKAEVPAGRMRECPEGWAEAWGYYGKLSPTRFGSYRHSNLLCEIPFAWRYHLKTNGYSGVGAWARTRREIEEDLVQVHALLPALYRSRLLDMAQDRDVPLDWENV